MEITEKQKQKLIEKIGEKELDKIFNSIKYDEDKIYLIKFKDKYYKLQNYVFNNLWTFMSLTDNSTHLSSFEYTASKLLEENHKYGIKEFNNIQDAIEKGFFNPTFEHVRFDMK